MKNKFRTRRLVLVVVILTLLAVIAFANRSGLRTLADQIAGKDYVGAGTSRTLFVVSSGESGTEVAKHLVDQGIVKTYDIVYRLMLRENNKFYPGSYSLRLKMSSSEALKALSNPSNLQVTKVTIQEGLRVGQVLSKLATATGIPLSGFQNAAANRSVLGVPTDAPSMEGYLFPATYEFPVKSTAASILKIMVNRCFEELDRFGVSRSDSLRVLTLASIIQKEARQSADFYKVSRVFTNRLNIDMPLQSDATVSYGSGGTTVTTTDAERASANGYNTYVRKGLPIGPISAPGSMAIDAALHPVSGKWLFFCAINLKTGETVFSETAAEHAIAVAKFRAWMAQNPGWNG